MGSTTKWMWTRGGAGPGASRRQSHPQAPDRATASDEVGGVGGPVHLKRGLVSKKNDFPDRRHL
jgi:hypothetical protein